MIMIAGTPNIIAKITLFSCSVAVYLTAPVFFLADMSSCLSTNSAIEFTLDAVYKNNYSKLVEMAKDMSAGMVLLVAIMSVFVGIILYGSYVFKLFFY